MCWCVAGQCGALWSADGRCPGLWPGPAGLLPGLWLRLQSGRAQPSHSGIVFFFFFFFLNQTLLTPAIFHFDLNHSVHLCHLVVEQTNKI